jgi:chromosomal replication initiator protein
MLDTAQTYWDQGLQMSNDFPFNHFINFNDSNKSNSLDSNVNSQIMQKSNMSTQNKTQQTQNQQVSDDGFDTNELNFLSEEIIEGLQSIISPQKFKAYFSNTFAVSNITNDTVIFSVTNNFIMKMIKNSYLEQIKQVLFNVLSTQYEIEFEVIGANLKKPTTQTIENIQIEFPEKDKTVLTSSFKIENEAPTSKEVAQEVESTYMKYNDGRKKTTGRFDRSKTFTNFVVGPSNNMAYAFSLAISKDPGSVYPQLYIFGNSGLGKTHILHALCNFISENKPHLRICFTNANEFMSEMVLSIQSNKISEFRRKYTELVDVLIIDDIHELKNKARTQSEFFFIFNELQSKGKQLVFTSDKQPKDINGIEDRIRTRLSSALLIDIQQPDLETRIAILKKKAVEKDIYLDDDVINLIASCVKTNVRELEGNLVKLGAYSDLMKVDIDLEIAKKQLKLSEDDDQKVITIEIITKAVSAYYRLAIGDIKGKTRKKEVALARHIAMYMSHKILKKTLEEIGEFFENRDHSTVIHGIKKIQNLIKEDSKLSQNIYEIESRL